MSESSKPSTSFGIVWPSVILAVLTSSAIIALRPDLESVRPELTTPADFTELPTTGGTLATFARPWEDPLAAARTHFEKKPDRPPLCLSELQEVLSSFVHLRDRTIVMPVWLRGGPYDDDKEQRLRTRFAVETALMVEGFLLGYPERMTYTVLTVPVKIHPTNKESTVSKDVIVPIKLYNRERNNEKAGVVVLWLSESDLGNDPLHANGIIISQLFETLVGSKAELAIIGPTNSDVYDKLAKTDLPFPGIGASIIGLLNSPPAPGPFLAASALLARDRFLGLPATVYSSRATSYKPEDRWASTYPILPIIGTDRNLLEKLQGELALRTAWVEAKGPGRNEKRDIILITEHDTRYGREFPKTMKTAFHIAEDNLHEFRYLRGIDGKVPGQSPDKKSTERDKDGDAKKAPPASKEISPTGQAQLDYLQRLVQQIKDKFAAQKDKGHEIVAIGVVGTDVYDKLLVLRALRKNFPETLFFTTDLDSELCRPSEYATTRNLIAVSHFGLGLRPEMKSPSFRDSYQTATFLACRFALGDQKDRDEHKLKVQDALDSSAGRKITVKDIPPLIFEIGKNGPYQLTEDKASVHPVRRHPWWMEWKFLGLLGIALVFFCIWAVFSKSIRDTLLFPAAGLVALCGKSPSEPSPDPPSAPSDNRIARLKTVVKEGFTQLRNEVRVKAGEFEKWQAVVICVILVLFLGLIIGLFIVSRTCHLSDDEEPVDISEGISIWPTIYLRVLAIGLSVILVRVVRYVTASESGWLYRWLDQRLAGIDGQVQLRQDLHGLQFWYPVIRNIVLYVIAAVFLFWVLRFPARPSRGWVTSWTDISVLVLAIASLMVLIFVILQTHHCFRKLIRRVQERTFQWQDSDEHGQEQLGYSADILVEVGRVTAIAAATRQLAYTGYFPFIVMAVMILARLTYFDHWAFTAPLVIVYLTNTTLLVYAALSIRKDAARLKQAVLERLHCSLAKALSDPDQANKKDLYEEAIRHVENVREGAFRPWLQEPIFESLGGIGGLLILQQVLIPYL